MERPPRAASKLGALWGQAATRIAVTYALIAAFWIVATDRVLLLVLAEDVARLSNVQTAKGLAFILFSTVMIFVLVRRATRQRARAEAALSRSRERLALALRSGNVGLWDVDLVSGELYVSPEWKAQLGFQDGAEPVPRTFMTLLHPEDAARCVAMREAAIHDPAQPYDLEVRLRHCDGSWRWIHTRGQVLRDGEGRAVRMIGVHTDVTQRRETEAQLRQAQRMEAIGQLTGGVAHDFNNLLTVVLGNAELLGDRVDADPVARQLTQTTLGAAERGAALTRRLLAFARRETLRIERVDPNRLVQGILPLLTRTLGEDVEIAADLEPEPWELEVDANQLENCVINLGVNARDALPDGGQVTIVTRRRVLPPPGKGALAPGDYMEIAVRDDGQGMAPAVLERAFEPFFTTKDVGKGSGLGLSMVYGFVRQSGGDVEIASRPGGGTTVRLLLPRARPRLASGDAGAAPEPPALGAGERVLVVEDDPAVRELMAGLLRERGYEVLEAADGPQALSLAGQPGRLELVITDMVMPGGMNGAALVGRLRALRPGLPALFVSGYSDRPLPGLPAEAEGGDPEGAPVDRNLGKPFTRRGLARAVRRTLDAGRGRAAEA